MSKESIIKDRIIRTAWELFSEKGFEATTLNDIIRAADISKGTFYYYFRSKDILLNTLSVILDDEYRDIMTRIPEELNSFDKLMFINYEIHRFIGEKVDYHLIANQYAAQLVKEGESNLLDKNRFYFTMLSEIIEEGQRRGELRRDHSVAETVRIYGLCERALVTDWCMNNGSYSLGEYSKEVMPMLFGAVKADN